MPKDYKELFEERAAIMQFDGGLSQKEAEEKAVAEITSLWLDDEKLSLTKPATYNALSKFKRELRK
jgi:hypothetical protein